MAKKYYGMYLGIVLQNDDPEKRGRLKIWIPHISVSLYDDWNAQANDAIFCFPDKETNPDLYKVMERLKDILPWSSCASPLFGGNASGRYNAPNQKGTTSDSTYWDKDGTLVDGQRPLHNYSDENSYTDAFGEHGKIHNMHINPYTNAYKPSNYSNLARGLFTIPNVGSHVWVFFQDGNPSSPIYFAASHGEEDWKRIYTLSQDEEDNSSVDYPGEYENTHSKDDGSTENLEGRTFRAKTVLNSNKHTIELIDTDNREILKLTHYAGSFKEFSNEVTTEFAVGNDQKQVLGDQFLTIRKNRSQFVQGDSEEIIRGTNIRWVGLSETEKVKKIVDLLKELNQYKRLFDVKRAHFGDIGPNQVSTLQERVGTFAKCPVCDGKAFVPSSVWNANALPRAVPFYLPTISKWNCVSSTFEVAFFPDPLTTAAATFVGQIGIHKASKCDCCNGPHLDKMYPAKYAHGQGLSPSTEGGNWDIDTNKIDGIQNWLKDNFNEIIDLEKSLTESNEIVNITGNKVETIGLVMNDLPSIRTDAVGKLRADGVHTAPEETYVSYKAFPLVEYVDVDDVPGGDYNITATNKFKLLVGARGISIKTFGPIDMYGTIVNLMAEQLNITSQNEISIEGGERISIRGRSISLLPYEHNPVLVNGQLHVTKNTIVQGSMMVEGELGVTHLTGPSQYYETLPSTPGATEIAGASNGFPPLPHSHSIPPHTHMFINLPINLEKSPPELRARMISLGINRIDGVAI